MPALFIITGTTRGLGAALARVAVDSGHAVVGLSRKPATHGETIVTDLADLQTLESRLQRALDNQGGAAVDRYVLVNNAAQLSPIGSRVSAAALQTHFTVNLAAPVLLARAFIDALAGHALPKRIINLSSGAASRPFRGWSAYCASKAGLDHFGRCIALEQADQPAPVDVLAFSPGVVDTGMQAQIRASDRSAFPDVDRFRDFHREGQLADPDAIARALLAAALSDRRYAGAVLRPAELP